MTVFFYTFPDLCLFCFCVLFWCSRLLALRLQRDLKLDLFDHSGPAVPSSNTDHTSKTSHLLNHPGPPEVSPLPIGGSFISLGTAVPALGRALAAVVTEFIKSVKCLKAGFPIKISSHPTCFLPNMRFLRWSEGGDVETITDCCEHIWTDVYA